MKSLAEILNSPPQPSLVRQARDTLSEHFGELVAMTGRYPVEYQCHGYRTVFRTREDVEKLLRLLETHLNA